MFVGLRLPFSCTGCITSYSLMIYVVCIYAEGPPDPCRLTEERDDGDELVVMFKLF